MSDRCSNNQTELHNIETYTEIGQYLYLTTQGTSETGTGLETSLAGRNYVILVGVNRKGIIRREQPDILL